MRFIPLVDFLRVIAFEKNAPESDYPFHVCFFFGGGKFGGVQYGMECEPKTKSDRQCEEDERSFRHIILLYNEYTASHKTKHFSPVILRSKITAFGNPQFGYNVPQLGHRRGITSADLCPIN